MTTKKSFGVTKPSYNRFLRSKFYRKFSAKYPDRSVNDAIDFAISTGFATEEELYFVIRGANEAPSYAEAIGIAFGILLAPLAILIALLTLGAGGGSTQQDPDWQQRNAEAKWNRRYKASPYSYHGDEVEEFFNELN